MQTYVQQTHIRDAHVKAKPQTWDTTSSLSWSGQHPRPTMQRPRRMLLRPYACNIISPHSMIYTPLPSASTIACTKPGASGVLATASTLHPPARNAASVVSPIAAMRVLRAPAPCWLGGCGRARTSKPAERRCGRTYDADEGEKRAIHIASSRLPSSRRLSASIRSSASTGSSARTRPSSSPTPTPPPAPTPNSRANARTDSPNSAASRVSYTFTLRTVLPAPSSASVRSGSVLSPVSTR